MKKINFLQREILFVCPDKQLNSYPLDLCSAYLTSTMAFFHFPESKELVSTMHGHTSAIHQISVHGSGRYAISSSHDTSILWDLDTFTRKRTLNGAQVVGVQEVGY